MPRDSREHHLAQEFERTLFVGHTHLAGVGSVGQLRDGDRRASFVLFDGRRVQFHRVDYDAATTAKKSKDDPDIDDIQGERLPEGR